jgi:NADH-quinone oxidoreductase subunit M
MSILTFIIFLPVLAAAAILLGAPARKTALASSGLGLLLSVIALGTYNQTAGGFQFQSACEIIPAWDLKFYVGADGLSLVLILLATLVTHAAVWVSPLEVKNQNAFYACVLLIAAGAIGAFASLDLFFFYSFHELALIPTFLLIGIWGSGDRQAAAWNITVYLALGSIVLLVGIIGLFQMMPVGERTFDIVKLQQLAAAHRLDLTNANWVYLCLLIGFGILISLFPFHTWAPQAYASAPTPAAMLHSGVLKKFGLYGLLRIAVPILPEAAQHWTNLLLIMLAGNVLWVGLATIAQRKLDWMIGYASVMHAGYIFLGIATLNIIGFNGAAFLIFSHGIAVAALFAVSGKIREQTGTLTLTELGGLAKTAPFLGLAFGFAGFAAIGLPGFGNFASEILIFFGAFKSGTGVPFTNFQIVTVISLWGAVISAIFMLRAYRAVFMGEPQPRWSKVTDAAASTRWPIVLLLAVLLLAGFYPQFFLNFIQPSMKALLALF